MPLFFSVPFRSAFQFFRWTPSGSIGRSIYISSGYLWVCFSSEKNASLAFHLCRLKCARTEETGIKPTHFYYRPYHRPYSCLIWSTDWQLPKWSFCWDLAEDLFMDSLLNWSAADLTWKEPDVWTYIWNKIWQQKFLDVASMATRF